MVGHQNLLIVDVKSFVVEVHALVERPHDGVVFQEVGECFVIVEVVDRNDFEFLWKVTENTEDTSANPSKTIDCYTDRHTIPPTFAIWDISSTAR